MTLTAPQMGADGADYADDMQKATQVAFYVAQQHLRNQGHLRSSAVQTVAVVFVSPLSHIPTISGTFSRDFCNAASPDVVAGFRI